MSATPLKSEVEARLDEVKDPCSLFNATNLSIVEMGLVRGVEIDGGEVRVRLLLTDPTCLYYFQIGRDIEARLLKLDGVERVSVENTADIWWSEDRMSPAARAKLAAMRKKRSAALQARRKAPRLKASSRG